MPPLTDVGSFWRTLREVDLNAVVAAAEAPFRLVVLGRQGTGRSTLVQQMRLDPRSGQASLTSALSEHRLPLPPEDAARLSAEHLDAVVLLLDAAQTDFAVEHAVFQALVERATPVVVAYNKCDLVADPRAVVEGAGMWAPAEVVAVAATDRASLQRALVPALLRVLKPRALAVARALPLFRRTVVSALIEETSFTNAAYSFGTGLAEIVPVLDVPLTVGDMVMLTKNQALMAFKIALAMGLSRDWRETIPQLAAVVGAGFLWRQLGRYLVGLIPAWGIIPKTAIAYAGTVAIGQAIYYWAETGEKLKPAALRETYVQAVERGRIFAQSLLRRRKAGEPGKALPAKASARRPRKGHCPHCNRRVPRDAAWCPYCGQAVNELPALTPGPDAAQPPPGMPEGPVT